MSQIIAKKGATTTLTCTKRNSETGAAESVASITITAKLRDDKFNNLATLTVTKPGGTGVFTIQINPADIASLPPSTFYLYIKYDYGTASDILDPVTVNIIQTGE